MVRDGRADRPNALSSTRSLVVAGCPVMDSVLYDTLLVAWTMGLALYFFALGRLVGATGWPRSG